MSALAWGRRDPADRMTMGKAKRMASLRIGDRSRPDRRMPTNSAPKHCRVGDMGSRDIGSPWGWPGSPGMGGATTAAAHQFQEPVLVRGGHLLCYRRGHRKASPEELGQIVTPVRQDRVPCAVRFRRLVEAVAVEFVGGLSAHGCITNVGIVFADRQRGRLEIRNDVLVTRGEHHLQDRLAVDGQG